MPPLFALADSSYPPFCFRFFSGQRLHTLGQSIHRHRRTRAHISGGDDAVRYGPALARHTHRQLGWIIRIPLFRRHHLRVLTYASERDGDSGWVRHFGYADGSGPRVLFKNGGNAFDKVDLQVLPRERESRTWILFRQARRLWNWRRTDSYKTGRTSSVHIPQIGCGKHHL